ncbi:hypothetical protein ACIPRD_30015 [Streptomyces sp. NPDC090108]|uniref:hypothetical protein n=1 Tax=Streptomyces sp. NPDC090108 TaxID=3365947 RepID=UPI00382A4CE6
MTATGTVTEPRGRGRAGRAMVILALVTPLLAGVGAVVAVAAWWLWDDTPDAPRPAAVPCAEALAYGGARLPAGARDAHCTVLSWQDTEYDARFRVSREGLRTWLKATYPDAPEPSGSSCDHPRDRCLDLDFRRGDGGRYAGRVPGRSLPGFGAYAATVEVRFGRAGDAEVSFSAFTG